MFSKKGRKKVARYIPLYLMMIPGLVYIFINNYIPMAGIVIAFKKMNYQLGIFKSPWVAFSNFEFLFKTNDFWIITRNTIGYNIIFIALGTFVAIGVALLLNEVRSVKLRKFYQTIILIPFMISTVIVSYLVFGFLSSDTGFMNKTILNFFGIDNINWYTTPKPWPYILTIVNLWKGFGYSTIIYFATVVGIDKTYYESAALDGANKFKQITYITLPLIRSTIIILVLMSISKIFCSDFGLFYQVPRNSGPLLDVTNTIDTYVYRGLVENNNIGMAAAASLYQSILGFILVITANKIVKKIDSDSSLF